MNFASPSSGASLHDIYYRLLLIIIKVLKVILVIGLVVGSVVAAKKYLFGDEKIDFSFSTKEEPSTCECPGCKAKLQVEYKFCPICGTARITVVEQKTVIETAQ